MAALIVVGALFTAASAMASGRTFAAQIPDINNGQSVAFDSNDDAWLSAANGIFKYGAFPSQSILDEVDLLASGVNGSISSDVAVDRSTHELYFADANGRSLDVFDEHGNLLREATTINGSSGYEGFHVAFDNSDGYSKGRLYLSLSSPENDIEAVDQYRRPVDFPATAPYIEGNRLTGTPSGPFSQVENVEVDPAGDLFVTDAAAHVVDEFDSTGTFLRTFPDPLARFSANFDRGEGGVGVDPTNGDVLIEDQTGIKEYDPFGNLLGAISEEPEGTIKPTGPAKVNSQGYAYLPAEGHSFGENVLDVYSPRPAAPKVSYESVANPTTTSGTLRATVDPNGGGNIALCHIEYGTTTSYGLGNVPCSPATEPYAGPTSVTAAISGLTVETTYHYRVVVNNANGPAYGADQTYTPHRVVGLTTEAATDLTETGATLNGSLVGDGTDTHYYFEWGQTSAYGHLTDAPPGEDLGSPTGPGATALSASLSSLAPYTTYHYRVVATNSAGTSYGDDQVFTTPPGVPSDEAVSASGVHSDHALVRAKIDPNGADTSYAVEYVPSAQYEESGFQHATSIPGPEVGIGMSKEYQSVSLPLPELASGTTYYYRFRSKNAAGEGGTVHTFTTFSLKASEEDHCPNSHVRQQTGSAQLLDCRGYEEVSAANTDGYDVESSLVLGQTPFGAYPEAENPSRVLYGVQDGGIPDTGDAPNRGVDPYVATRTEQGWSTQYVGIEANGTPSTKPFSSTVAEADPSLDTFAFGGSEICSPCFADGSTGIPIHDTQGQLVQGMVGSVLDPAAEPAGFIGKYFSANGNHFVFGSTSKLEEDGAEGGISIYDRNLTSDETHVVSKAPGGGNLTCLVNCSTDGIGELGISKDGSRILIGQLVAEVGGARYWHLYMDTGDSSKTIDLTPGTTHGVLYDGMTSDGSKVFFTTVDPLATATDQDSDGSADIYEAAVSGEGGVDLARLSTGTEGTGNGDSCDPAADIVHGALREHWNTIGSKENCGVVAVGGGGGVAAGDGTIYFLSPEQLDGSAKGVQNAPNLYVVRPGKDPRFVATLESSLTGPDPLHSQHQFRRNFGAFSAAEFVAVDNSGGPSDGDVYVADTATDVVWKYDASGNLVTNWASNGKLAGIPPYQANFGSITGLSVDSSGTLYVVDSGGPSSGPGEVFEFSQNGALTNHFPIESRHLARNPGMAVDSAGDIYTAVEGFSQFQIRKQSKTGEFLGYVTPSSSLDTFAIDPSTDILYTNRPGGGIDSYEFNGSGEVIEPAGKTCALPLEFEHGCPPSGHFASRIQGIEGITVNPTTHEIYADLGTEVIQLDLAGNQVGTPIGVETLHHSRGVAVSANNLVYATNNIGVQIAAFGPTELSPEATVVNPLVIDSVSSPDARNTADFQVTPTGNFASFPSTLPLTGYDSGGHEEVYRYDAVAEALQCASCNPTFEQATGDSSLPTHGSGLSNDGRVFFNSAEGLVDRDLNEQEDAYEWEPQGFEVENVAGTKCTTAGGCVELISTGGGAFAASLLGVSAEGTDAYFFTRDKLVEQDENGNTVKIYDARELGGFPYAPPAAQCKASDECHGPGSPAPPPTEINTVPNRAGGNAPVAKCGRGSLRKRGKCVRKHRKAKRSHHRGAHHG